MVVNGRYLGLLSHVACSNMYHGSGHALPIAINGPVKMVIAIFLLDGCDFAVPLQAFSAKL